MPITVKKKKGETNDDMISKFRKVSIEDNVSVVEEVRARVSYVSPSERRQVKKKLQKWRNQLRRQGNKR